MSTYVSKEDSECWLIIILFALVCGIFSQILENKRFQILG